MVAGMLVKIPARVGVEEGGGCAGAGAGIASMAVALMTMRAGMWGNTEERMFAGMRAKISANVKEGVSGRGVVGGSRSGRSGHGGGGDEIMRRYVLEQTGGNGRRDAGEDLG